MKDKLQNKLDSKNKIVIEQNTDDSLLQVLLKEYELTLSHIEGIDGRLIQVVAGTLGFLAISVGYFLNQQKQLSFQLAWIIPMFFITIATIFIFIIYLNNVYIWNARILSKRINSILNEKALISYDPEIPGTVFLSPKRGSLKSRLMYVILFASTIILFILVTVILLNIIYNQSHAQASLFVLVYGFLTMVILFIGSGLLSDIPNSYRDLLERFPTAEGIPTDFRFKPSRFVISSIHDTFASVIPRMPDLIGKSFFFIFGFVTAVVVTGLSPDHLLLINVLFRYSNSDWKSITDIPVWVVWTLGAIYFTIEEILLQQAKLMWDDIRDIERDKLLLHNSRRPIATGRISKSAAISHMIFRGSIALLLGYLLGGLALLLAFLLISFHQIVYVLWAKPKATKYPLLPLFVVSFNNPLRFLAGLAAVVGFQWTLTPFVLLFVLFYFYPLGVIALQWKIEPEYQQSIHQKVTIRPQSIFFLKYGEFWQHVGLIAAVLFSGFTVFVSFMNASCDTTPLLQQWYRHCDTVHGVVTFISLGILNSVVLILGFIALFMLIAILLVLLFKKIHFFSIIGNRRIKGLTVPLLFILYVCVFILAIAWNNFSFLTLSFFVLSILFLFTFEKMSYLEYTFTNLKNRFPFIVGAWYAYLFKPLPNLGLKEVLAVTFTDINITTLKTMLPDHTLMK